MDTTRIESEKQLMTEKYPDFEFKLCRTEKLQLAGWYGEIKIINVNYRLGIILSKTFPNTRPYVFVLDKDYNIKQLDTPHQDKNRNLCLYTSDGTENSWHREYSIVDVISRFKAFMYSLQKGKHQDIHETIINPFIDLTDEVKYVADFVWFPIINGDKGYITFEKSLSNSNFYYGVSVEDKWQIIESKENVYFKNSREKIENEKIKWIYLKRENMGTILKLRKKKELNNFMNRKESANGFIENNFKKCIVYTGRDQKKILINLHEKLSFSNVIGIKKDSFFARNKGLIDSDLLKGKTVAIFGLGSLGSRIAEMLCRSGISNFILFDYDQMTPENLSRHTLTTEDLFLNKADAIKERILRINPFSETISLSTSKNILFFDHLYEEITNMLKKSDLVVCATGDEETEYEINYVLKDISDQKVIPIIFSAILGNGFGGRFHRIEIGKTPCYKCIKMQQESNPTLYKLYTEETFTETNEYEYGIYSEAGIPGLDVNINIVASLVVKMALETLLGKTNGIFKFNSYIWGNQKGWIFDEPFSLKDIRFSRISDCPICGT